MRKGILLGVAFLLSAGLTACGGNGQILLPGSYNEAPSSDDQNYNFGVPLSTSSDPLLESLAKQVHSPSYSGSIVVQLKKSDGIYFSNNRLETTDPASEAGTAAINYALFRAGGVTKVEGLFGNNLRQQKNEKRQLEILSGHAMSDKSAFFKITVADTTRAEFLLRSLWKAGGVKAVYPKLRETPTALANVPEFSNDQRYLLPFNEESNTLGLNVEAMWNAGAMGQGVRVLDYEYGWFAGHEDLNANPRYFDPVSSGDPSDKAHGTAVLGLLVGIHNGHGVKGVSPFAEVFGIRGTVLRPGDIRLFEYQNPGPHNLFCGRTVEEQVGCVPLEVWPDYFAMFQHETEMGYLIVEGSSNGSINLDDPYNWFPDGPQPQRVNGEIPPEHDSGSIMVGGTNADDRGRPVWSNYGSRVDLIAKGVNVTTTIYPGGGWGWNRARGGPPVFEENNPHEAFTNEFGGTSASSAIAVGLAAVLQSYAKMEMGEFKYIRPKKVRELLMSDGLPGTDDSSPFARQPRMDRVKEAFDTFWAEVQRDFPELADGEEIRGERRRALRERGIGLNCEFHDESRSDPSCPKTAACPLAEPLETSPWGSEECDQPRCMVFDEEKAGDDLFDCAAGVIWPSGIDIGKALDFDADGKADLVNATPSQWQIDLSSRGNTPDKLGAWDLTVRLPQIDSRWIWPVAEDYNSDRRVDIAVYDKEHGVWYIKFMTTALLQPDDEGQVTFAEWDWEIQHPYHDELNRNYWNAKYGRPVPGDYNGDSYIDLAVARSDGIWSIDFGGPRRADYGTFDQNITYLTPQQLSAYPGWAYLPVGFLGYKTPTGEYWGVDRRNDEINRAFVEENLILGGNEVIAIDNPNSGIALKYSDGTWSYWNRSFDSLDFFGGLDCQPFVTDFNGDKIEDRAVQCPNKFIVYLNGINERKEYPLDYNRNIFSLPGRPYFGGIPYDEVITLIELQLNSSPEAPIIPVDMAH